MYLKSIKLIHIEIIVGKFLVADSRFQYVQDPFNDNQLTCQDSRGNPIYPIGNKFSITQEETTNTKVMNETEPVSRN